MGNLSVASVDVLFFFFWFQRQRKIQKERLLNDFSAALNSFQKIQRQAANREREFVARVRASSRVSVRTYIHTHTLSLNHRVHSSVFTFFVTGRAT